MLLQAVLRALKLTAAVFLTLILSQTAALAASPRPTKATAATTTLRKKSSPPAKLVKAAATTKETATFDDCDICHENCLISSLACIAISAITGCAPCGVVCLAAQAACQVNCNRSKACQNPQMEESNY